MNTHTRSTYTFAPFRDEDYPAVRALWAASDGVRTGPGDSPGQIEKFLQRNAGLSHVVWNPAREAIVGAILCGHDGRRGCIYHLSVAKLHRRQGLAAALVRKSLLGLQAEGIERCQVFVLAENTEAKVFWKKMLGVLRTDLVVFSIDLPQ